jgi:hypothetical protein
MEHNANNPHVPYTQKLGESDVSSTQNITFVDNTPGVCMEYPTESDTTYVDGAIEDVPLGEFLSRPVKIHEGVWALGTTIDLTENVWDLFFNTPAIVEKLQTYGLIRCSLKLKIMSNGSPFNYGHLYAAYEPLPNFVPGRIMADAVQFVHLSQRPGVWINVSINESGIMTLPYVNYKNWLRIGTRQDFIDMGRVRYFSPTPLFNCNNATEGSAVIVYAWAEDVQLSAPTSQLAMQSGKRMSRKTGRVTNTVGTKPAVKAISDDDKTEYKMGPVSRVATAVAAATDVLKQNSVIAPFAIATGIGARAVKAFAGVFGWTNPPVIENVLARKDLPFHAIASPNISTPLDKLTIDPKNELTVDSRTVGLDGTDELTISSIVSRSAYIFNCPWNAADPTSHTLCTINVGPQMHRIVFGSITGQVLSFSPMSHLSQAFTHWRGDIIYEIRIVCSQYHRGRLQAFWDPNGFLGGAANLETKVYSKIYDIQHDQIIELRIPYVQDRAYKRVKAGNPSNPVITDNFSNSDAALAYDAARFNGQLQLKVANLLRCPVDTTEVRILISARGAENLDFANPSNPPRTIQNWNVPLAQSGERELGLDNTSVDEMTDAHDPIELNYLVNMGEKIGSIRNLLRRCTFHRVLSVPANTTARTLNFKSRFGHFPFYYGFDPNGVHLTVGADPFSFVNNTPLNWFSPCFVGYRGSLNYHFNAASPELIDNMSVLRTPGETRSAGTYRSFTITFVGATDSSISHDAVENKLHGDTGGYAVTNQKTQTGLSAQLPMYSPYRMRRCDIESSVLGSALDESNSDSYELQVQLKPVPSGHDSAETEIQVYVGAGTDFTLFFYLNTPSYFVGGIPSPSNS